MKLTALDIQRKQERDTAKTNQFFKRMGLTQQQLELPHVNLYCKAKVLSVSPLISNKDKKYCVDFMRFWQFKQGAVSKKAIKHMYGMIKYYTQKQNNLDLRNARLARKKSSN